MTSPGGFLAQDDFVAWWGKLPDDIRFSFKYTHGGTDVEARFVCALERFGRAGKLRHEYQGSESEAYAYATDCDPAHAEGVYRSARAHPATNFLIAFLRGKEEDAGSQGIAAPAPQPKRSLAAHLNTGVSTKARRRRADAEPADYVELRLTVDVNDWSEQARYFARDLYTFAYEVMGFRDMASQPHDEMCAFLQPIVQQLGENEAGQLQLLLLVPRGCFKTSIAVQALAIYILLWFPNARILLDSATKDLAKQNLSAIKGFLERPVFQALYGDWVTGAESWHAESIKINRRTLPLKEGSIDIGGVDKPHTGGHYDLILCDDLHNELNVASELQRKKVKRHIATLDPILEPHGGVLLVIGTRWHHADAYGKLVKADKEQEEAGRTPVWRKLIRSCYLTGGELYFPSLLDEAVLAKKRITLTDEEFANWYLNEPVEESSKIFPKGIRQYFMGRYMIAHSPIIYRTDVPQDQARVPVYVTLAWDPPTGREPTETTDWHGFTYVGADTKNDWYIFEAEQKKGVPSDIIDHVVYRIRCNQPRKISVEDMGGSGMWIELLVPELRKHGIKIPVVPYKLAKKESKIARIKSMQPKFKEKGIWILKGLRDLDEQLDEFPQLEHEDIIDTLPQHKLISRPADPEELAPFALDEEDFDAEDPAEEPISKARGWWAGRGTSLPKRTTVA